MELDCDESCQFHGSCSRIWLGRIRRAFHNRRDQVIDEKAGGPSEPPAGKVIFLLLASALGRRLRLGHLLSQLRFDGFKVETRASLHWRVIEEGLKFFADDLLDEHET